MPRFQSTSVKAQNLPERSNRLRTLQGTQSVAPASWNAAVLCRFSPDFSNRVITPLPAQANPDQANAAERAWAVSQATGSQPEHRKAVPLSERAAEA